MRLICFINILDYYVSYVYSKPKPSIRDRTKLGNSQFLNRKMDNPCSNKIHAKKIQFQ